MGLSNLVLRSDAIEIPVEGGVESIPLYGLGADAVAFLAHSHGAALGAIYAMAVEGKLTIDNVGDVISELLDEAPIVVATVIAFGAREPTAVDFAAQLPFATQIEAVEKIVKLTFAGDHAPKKVVEVVNRMVEAVAGLLRQTSTSSSGASGSS